MTISERIEAAKTRWERANQERIKTETQLQTAKEQCDEVIERMEALGVTPDTIDQELQKLGAEIEKELTAIEAAIPSV